MTKKNSILRAQSRGDSGFARVLTIVAMMLLFLMTGATSAMADPVTGDVNGDDVCDIADVAAVISVMGGDNTYAATADVNGDSEINVADIAQIYSLMAQQSGTSTGTKVVLTANDITVANGNEAGLTIRMDYETEQTITGVAFSLYLPDGILLKGFDTKEAQDAAKASALKKACDLGEDGVWGEDATSGWLSVKQKEDGGLLFVFIDQLDKTAFESTKAPLITINVHAVADVAATASIKNISVTSDSDVSLEKGNIADVTFGINQAAVPEEPAVEAGTVTLADGTEDASNWQGKAGEGEYQALPLEGVAAGTAVSVKYTGTRRVKSVKAVKAENILDMRSTPLTVEALTAGTVTVIWPKDGMQYSKNGGAKTAMSGKTDIELAAGDQVAFYGNGTSITQYYGTQIGGSGDGFQVKVYGNIMSLVDETGFATATTLTAMYAFNSLFYSNTTITDISSLVLPATELTQQCYSYMFYGCKGLTALSADLLPATTLANGCYNSMFAGCTGLTTVPANFLPATNLAEGCYSMMFYQCTGLTTVPADLLPATELAQSCYSSMFEECSNLTAAPDLPAPALVYQCYARMFSNCSKLASIKCLAQSGFTYENLTQWVIGVAETGTFYAVSSANWTVDLNNGIPEGHWTRVNIDN